ncbi:olfactory receptor 2A2 [Tupaia chinensis]|uniref:Olfactory receptor n=1 Tax=Tupaia chinensis TaxID=246437 RepID=L9JB93_TUPCH|nr:olfactory receptor 2A2 [Tupaia chinensis]ELW47519.1 Olfactory receptor 2A2 [Tupaia chinensis]
METNQSWVTEFILMGFQLSSEMELLLFWVFSLLYIFGLLANGIILGLIWSDPQLHTPMYFFLSHLAIIDISYASSSIPNMLRNLVQHKRTISFISCLVQMTLCLAVAGTECMILVLMSYDRYVAICHPLQYTIIMNWRRCTVLAVISWVCGFSLVQIHIILLLRLPFCGPQEVNHFFCEILAVLKLACADTWVNTFLVFAGGVLILIVPLSLMLISYTCILWDVLKIQSKEGRKKAFSTCSSHLCVVGLYFGIAMLMYLVPDDSQRQEPQKILTLFYGLFNPLLNPLIYSLRNAQVKGAFYRALGQKRAT